jgi:hypothetical protein
VRDDPLGVLDEDEGVIPECLGRLGHGEKPMHPRARQIASGSEGGLRRLMLMPQIGKTQAPLRNHALGLMQAGSFVHGASEKKHQSGCNASDICGVGLAAASRQDLG